MIEKNITKINDQLIELELFAYKLAKDAGNKINSELKKPGKISYKNDSENNTNLSNPVSETDKNIEISIRKKISEKYPSHKIIGEESTVKDTFSNNFVWVIDPIDGTTNFINGLPIFGCSVGLLYNNSPIVGAIWLSSSHELLPGTYHGSINSKLKFNGKVFNYDKESKNIKRRLHSMPYAIPSNNTNTDIRVTGCAVFEIAMLATGILDGGYLNNMRLWDVVAGVALLKLTKKEIWIKNKNKWEKIEKNINGKLILSNDIKDIQKWHGTLIVGNSKDIDILKNRFKTKQILKGLMQRFFNILKYNFYAKLKAMANISKDKY
jgi:myo-inositol-1(or 4)-monophosphatase